MVVVVADRESDQGDKTPRAERPVLSPAVAEFVRRTVAAAPPMSAAMISDLRLIIWGLQADPPVTQPGKAVRTP